MSKRDFSEVPGNSYVSAVMLQREMVKLAEALYRMDSSIEKALGKGEQVRSIKMRAPGRAGGEWLAVMTVDTKEGAFVAFHSAEGYVECLKGLATRYCNGSLKFKEERPYNG